MGTLGKDKKVRSTKQMLHVGKWVGCLEQCIVLLFHACKQEGLWEIGTSFNFNLHVSPDTSARLLLGHTVEGLH